MSEDLDKIKADKIKEAQELFETIGITQEQEEEQYSSEIPVYSENSNPEENKEFKFHWTRLSINSNSSCVID